MAVNIPVQLTPFIGRQREIADVKRLMADSRLLTLTGPGGSGKSRLVIAVAQQFDEEYEGGLVWIELASITDESLVPKAVAKGLGVSERAGRSVREVLVDFLTEKRLLLVLDNCEHLITACAQMVDSFLRLCPEVHFLVTSREPMALTGEVIYPVPALSYPTSGLLAEISSLEKVHPEVLEDLDKYESITLFLNRAAAILPGITMTGENARAIAEICFKLDGMPLAIELAAARVNVLTVNQIAARLDDRFTLLSSAKRAGIAPRHQSLRAAIDWSYDLLTPPEQVVLLRLSVFAAGCSLATAEAVCKGDGVERGQILTLLSSLVNKSFVVAETLRRGEARYVLQETIRQYAEEKLKASGEWSIIHDRNLEHFLQLTEETEPKLRGEYQQLWLNWLEDEYDNSRAALNWSLQSDRLESGRIEAGLRIAIALYQFWTIRDYVEEGLAWLERLLPQADEGTSPLVRANALAYASFLAGFRGHSGTQMAYGDEAAILAEALGDEGKPALVWALTAQAYGLRAAGDYQTEFTLVKRVIELHRELGHKYYLGIVLSTYSFTAMSLGEYGEARAMLDEGLPLLREVGNPYRIAMALNFSGDLARCEGNYALAQTAYEESLSLLREIDAERDMASVFHNLGHARLHLGNVEHAHALFRESMAIHKTQQNRPGMAECLIGFAALAIVSDLPAAGARLLSSAVAIGGQQITSAWAATRMEYEHYLARARSGLTEKAFQAEKAVGQQLSLEQAVADAQDVARKAMAAQKARKQLDELTPREREVASLIAQAKSNEEIAEELVVSKRTVEKHIANIRSKLDFTNRAQIVRWAIETGLEKSTE